MANAEITRAFAARQRTCAARPRREHGAVLIVALILLVILTMLGVSSMNTSSLEERMATNTQESNRAFHAAETGLSSGFENGDAYDLTGPYTPAQAQVADTATYFQFSSDFLDWSPPPSGSLYSATSFQAAHFDFRSEGETSAGVSSVLHGGAYQIAPKAQ